MLLSGRPHIFDIDPVSFASSTNLLSGTVSPAEALGAKGEDTFGNTYRFGKVGASTLVTGNLLQGPTVDTQFVDLAVASAAAAGQNQVTVTNGTTAITAGMFDGGFAVVSVTPGIGQRFTIKNYQLAANGASNLLTFYENITTALTTSSKITMYKNPFNGLVAQPTTPLGQTVGAALAAGTTGVFTWVGVNGVFGLLSDATTGAIGDGVSASVTTAGTVTKAITLKNRLGMFYVASVSAQVEPVLLQLH